MLITDFHNDTKKAVIRSQHVQRNWDLDKAMPQEDVDLLIHAATNCPSKQNFAFYDLHVIQDRDTIERIYSHTKGLGITNPDTGEAEFTTNSQVLAHTLFVFTDTKRSDRYVEKWKSDDFEMDFNWKRDQDMAVGIAAGYINVIASQLGYGTGCCACFESEKVIAELGKNPEETCVVLMMGVGIKSSDKNRRIHQETGVMMPTHTKEPITVYK